MKKALSLLLAALLVLTSVAVLAEPSKDAGDMSSITSEGATVELVDNPTIQEQIQQVLAALQGREDVIGAFDAEAQDALKAIFGDKAVEVNEIVAISISDIEPEVEKVKITLTLATKYPEGTKIAAVLELHPDLTNYEQVVAEGLANAQGDVEFEIDPETAQKVKDALYTVVIVVNEKFAPAE